MSSITKSHLQAYGRIRTVLNHLSIQSQMTSGTTDSNKSLGLSSTFDLLESYVPLRDALFSNLIQRDIFPKLNITRCFELAEKNVTSLFNAPEAKAITELFTTNGLPAQLGYNSGSGDLNIVMQLPTLDTLKSISFSPTPQQLILYTMLGLMPDQIRLECDYEHCVRHGNLFYFVNNEIRNTILANTTDEKKLISDRIVTLLRDRAPTPVLLANRCLHVFFAQTQIAITSRKLDYALNTLTLTIASSRRHIIGVRHAPSGAPPTHEYLVTSALELLEPESLQDTRLLHEELNFVSDINGNASFDIHSDASFASPIIYTDDGSDVFRYSPIYYLLSGFNYSLYMTSITKDAENTTTQIDSKSNETHDGRKIWSLEYNTLQRDVVSNLLVQQFWTYITNVLRYFPSQDLYKRVTEILYTYMQSGTSRVSASFNPDQPMTIFLWGTAGTGKSTFVRVFSDATRFLVSRIFEPNKRVDIVRVPFNQTSPAALISMLMVRGISDWSLERIVEQCVCRAGIGILHLEEQPPSPELQDELFGLTSKMVQTLCNRYPEYRHNVINLLTSNYPPSANIEKKQGNQTVLITPPDKETQAIWCSRTLEDIVASNVIQLPFIQTVLAQIKKQSREKRNKTSNTSSSSVKLSPEVCNISSLPELPSFLTYPTAPPYFQDNTVSSSVVKLPPTEAGAQRFLRFLLSVNLTSYPPYTADLRKLETWKRSVAFSVLSHLYNHAESALSIAQNGAIHPLSYDLPTFIGISSSRGSPFYTQRKQERMERARRSRLRNRLVRWMLYSWRTTPRSIRDKSAKSDKSIKTPYLPPTSLLQLALKATFNIQQHPTIQGASLMTVNFMNIPSNISDSTSNNTSTDITTYNTQSDAIIPSLHLVSLDGFFYCFDTSDDGIKVDSKSTELVPASQRDKNNKTGKNHQLDPSTALITSSKSDIPISTTIQSNMSVPIPPIPLPNCIPPESWPRIYAILDMWRSNFLRPAVLVLSGTKQQIEESAAYVRKLVSTMTKSIQLAKIPPHQRFTVKDTTVLVNSNILALDMIEETRRMNLLPTSSDGTVENIDNTTITDDTIISPHLASQYFFPNQPDVWGDISKNNVSTQNGDNVAEIYPPLLEFYANATTEAHRRQLFGDPEPASGALLRFIQTVNLDNARFAKSQYALDSIDTTNETMKVDNEKGNKNKDNTLTPQTDENAIIQPENASVGVIYARVNSLGQFMLRELLDAGDSSTHITSVKKDRLLFVVMVEKCEEEAMANASGDQTDDKSSNIQPQLVSRSHAIINLR